MAQQEIAWQNILRWFALLLILFAITKFSFDVGNFQDRPLLTLATLKKVDEIHAWFNHGFFHNHRALSATKSASAIFNTPLAEFLHFGPKCFASSYRALLINLFEENEYDSDVYSPLPKHRNASLRERVSSVNSEVTIHDVRRCTITGTWVQLTSAIKWWLHSWWTKPWEGSRDTSDCNTWPVIIMWLYRVIIWD